MTDEKYLEETKLLDFNHPSLARLVQGTNWLELGEFDKIGAIYRFVKDDIRFGYNESMTSRITCAARRLWPCNTKTTLLMALLRSARIRCRIHGSAIDKRVQKGVLPDLIYALAPDRLLHTWAEVLFDGRWVRLEGCILDGPYLEKVQACFRGERIILRICCGSLGLERASCLLARTRYPNTKRSCRGRLRRL